jgi:hypothetical protein
MTLIGSLRAGAAIGEIPTEMSGSSTKNRSRGDDHSDRRIRVSEGRPRQSPGCSGDSADHLRGLSNGIDFAVGKFRQGVIRLLLFSQRLVEEFHRILHAQLCGP